ncbi:MAG: hypothetical protein HFACDABA_00364 [Anaerolineales bacterium]|nr:hypothetical protein [Anaerolineales bacterium]
MSENKTFPGTYFDRDTVLKLSRWADILAWVIALVYALDLLLALVVFLLSMARGFWVGGFTDIATNLLYIIERPFRGVVYFIALQAIGKTMLMLMDMEENTRRAARK